MRHFLYTSEPHYWDLAKSEHPTLPFDRTIRTVLGHAIRKGDGNFKEKGVDALLVADMIYHAAVRNYDHAMLVSVDTDFVHAMKRVEDFGCRTSVLGVCAAVPDRLREVTDDAYEIDQENMIRLQYAEPVVDRLAEPYDSPVRNGATAAPQAAPARGRRKART